MNPFMNSLSQSAGSPAPPQPQKSMMGGGMAFGRPAPVQPTAPRQPQGQAFGFGRPMGGQDPRMMQQNRNQMMQQMQNRQAAMAQRAPISPPQGGQEAPMSINPAVMEAIQRQKMMQ